jgi:tetrahydromethanopterin S-methyltransferase subunit F
VPNFTLFRLDAILFGPKPWTSLPITTLEESTKWKERQLLGRKDSLGLEEKRVAENVRHVGFGPIRRTICRYNEVLQTDVQLFGIIYEGGSGLESRRFSGCVIGFKN